MTPSDSEQGGNPPPMSLELAPTSFCMTGTVTLTMLLSSTAMNPSMDRISTDQNELRPDRRRRRSAPKPRPGGAPGAWTIT